MARQALKELLECCLDALRQAFLNRGLPRRLYLDNAPAFRSFLLYLIIALLGIALIHGEPIFNPRAKAKSNASIAPCEAAFFRLCGLRLCVRSQHGDRWLAARGSTTPRAHKHRATPARSCSYAEPTISLAAP